MKKKFCIQEEEMNDIIYITQGKEPKTVPPGFPGFPMLKGFPKLTVMGERLSFYWKYIGEKYGFVPDSVEKEIGTGEGPLCFFAEAQELFLSHIKAAEDCIGADYGQKVKFVLSSEYHTNNGKHSPLELGGTIYVYEHDQFCRVISVPNTEIDYSHSVYIAPYKYDYKVNIPAGKKLLYYPIGAKVGSDKHELKEKPAGGG